MCSPSALAPKTSGLVGHCILCGVQWQIKTFGDTSATDCHFCGAGPDAVRIEDESEDYSGGGPFEW